MRRYCRVSATEALYGGMPRWELDLLLAGLEAEFPPEADDETTPEPGRRFSLTTEED